MARFISEHNIFSALCEKAVRIAYMTCAFEIMLFNGVLLDMY